METSRDDFVIAIRSAFLKKGNKQRFSLVGLIFFSIILLVLGKLNFKAIDYLKISIKELIYRSSFIVSVPENYLFETYSNIERHFNFYNEYLGLKSELTKLKSEKLINSFIILENKRLKQLVDDYIINSKEIVGKVLIDKQSPFLKSVIINKGSKNNIKLGMAVLDNEYLVGKVVEVNYTTSRVLLISDLNSKIPVSIEPGNIQSILSGTGKNNGVIQYLKENKEIKEGSIIYTSGSGGLFRSGIPIGLIESLNDPNIEKSINFFSNFSQLKFVKIISFKKEEN